MKVCLYLSEASHLSHEETGTFLNWDRNVNGMYNGVERSVGLVQRPT
jgi:hypothetical protein